MKKIITHVAWMVLLTSMVGVQAGEYVNGVYFGGKIGVNTSSARGVNTSQGVTNAAKAATVAYGLQGGYLEGGYIFDSKTLVLGVGAYYDLNPAEKHTNGTPPILDQNQKPLPGYTDGFYYASRAFGLDVKVGLPLGRWMPYTKLGYGYSTGTSDLSTVASNSLNGTLGVEYKFANQWSALGEYKWDGFGGKNNATSIKNKTLAFGINYYFDAPPAPVVVEPVEVEEPEVAPVPVAAPVPVDDAPPI